MAQDKDKLFEKVFFLAKDYQSFFYGCESLVEGGRGEE